MRTTAVSLACLGLLACGGAARPTTISGDRPSTTARTLSEDLDELDQAVGTSRYFPQHVSFLGWAGDTAMYRAVVCAADELGGRGDACDLYVCAVAADVEPDCERPASFELYDEPDYDRARTSADAEAAAARKGPLTPGRELSTDAVTVTVADLGLTFAAAGQPARTIVEPPDAEYRTDFPGVGVIDVTVAAVNGSPDGACVAAVGLYGYRGEYEGVQGRVVSPFGAVACKR